MWIKISIALQSLELFEDGLPEPIKTYSISTALKGVGQQEGSGQTPLGRHEIAQCIGGECPLNAVFVGREWTNEIYTPELAEKHPERDWILSRILRLRGLEAGFNQGGDVDSYARYIYIHGTPDTEPMGIAKSHGCIRMRNLDVMELFEWVDLGTRVEIVA